MYYTISNGGGEEKLNQLSIAISFSQVETDISICFAKGWIVNSIGNFVT